MSSYELMLVTPTSLSKEQEGAFFEKTESTIKNHNGEVTSKTPMGKKKLAYEISKQNEGIYTLIEFNGNGSTIDELERILKISGEVLRHGVFKIERKKENGKLK